MNNHSELLLQSVCRAADMGRSSLQQLIKGCKDNTFNQLLKQQYDDCNRIYISGAALLGGNGEKPESAPFTGKLMSGAMVAAATVTSGEPDKYADMLVQGNLKGIKQITEDISRYSAADSRARNLAICLRDRLDANNRQLKKYL